jgi:hypothetical protein
MGRSGILPGRGGSPTYSRASGPSNATRRGRTRSLRVGPRASAHVELPAPGASPRPLIRLAVHPLDLNSPSVDRSRRRQIWQQSHLPPRCPASGSGAVISLARDPTSPARWIHARIAASASGSSAARTPRSARSGFVRFLLVAVTIAGFAAGGGAGSVGLSSFAGGGAAGSGSLSTGGGICRFPTDRVMTIAGTSSATALRFRCGRLLR